MNRSQATRFVLERAQAGFGIAEISLELSRELSAPLDMVQRFVEQVFDESAREQESLAREEKSAPHPDPRTPKYSGLPPGLQSVLGEYEAAGAPRPVEAEPAAKRNTVSEAELPRQAAFEAPSRGTGKYAGKELPPEMRRQLAEEIFQQLKKKRRVNDVTEYVCVKTGWHWNKSQRFVARVRTEHHDELHGPQHWKLLPSAGVALTGLFLAIMGAKWLFDYAKLAVFSKTNPEALLALPPANTFLALMFVVFGVGMMSGGLYGIGRGLIDE
ncbi:MAG TPA: hypothetical protein EYP88_01450 [Anaerolineales bacterium]|nr:hypothetical protein [Anaerolineales bacterium]